MFKIGKKRECYANNWFLKYFFSWIKIIFGRLHFFTSWWDWNVLLLVKNSLISFFSKLHKNSFKKWFQNLAIKKIHFKLLNIYIETKWLNSFLCVSILLNLWSFCRCCGLIPVSSSAPSILFLTVFQVGGGENWKHKRKRYRLR